MYSDSCLELPELLRWEFKQAMEPLTCFFSGLAGLGAGRGGPFSKIRLLVPSTIRRDNRNWRQAVTPPREAFPLAGHRLPGWWSEAGPAWGGRGANWTGPILGDGVPPSPKEVSPNRTKNSLPGRGFNKSRLSIIIAILGCHALDIRFPAVNSLPLMSPKTVYPAGTKILSPVNPANSPRRTKWAGIHTVRVNPWDSCLLF